MSLRLAYVNTDPGIPPDGTKGASVHFREFGRALVRSGCRIQAVVSRPPRSEFSDFPVSAHPLPSSPDPVGRELLQLTRQSGVFDALADAGPFDIVYERYSLFGLAGLTFARHHGLPFFLEVNAPLWEEAARYRSLMMPELARSTARELFGNATKVLAVSDGLRKRLVADGVPAERVQVFPNGVSPLFYHPTRPAARPRMFVGRPTVLFVGSLKPWHGVEFLLQGFARLRRQRDVCLWVVGDGPLAGAVDRAAAESPDDIVRTRAVPHEMVPGVLRAADVTVAPYTAESPDYFCPLKVVEALASGIPVLASDVAAVRGLDVEGARLHRFSPGDSGSFARVLDQILANIDAERQAAMSVNPTLAKRRFTWDRRVADLIQLASPKLRERVATANLGAGPNEAVG